MPRPRTPKLKAEISGRHLINPARFRGRNSPVGMPALGDPPKWMNPGQKAEWRRFKIECPWLNASHTALLEIACVLRVRVRDAEGVGTKALNLLRQCLGQMGATPADATKVTVPDAGEENPDDSFLSGGTGCI